MAEYKKTFLDRVNDLAIGGIRTTGRIVEKGLFGFNWTFTMVSGTAMLLALGLGVDMATESQVTGIQPPTWNDLRDWVHNNLANNPPNE